MPFCPEGAIIIVDGMRECQIADSLDKLISDLEKADTLGNPISAGSEGDREALRKLPDVSRIPFTNDSGFFNELAYISRQTNFETADDYEAYAARLTELPRYFRQHRANMTRGICPKPAPRLALGQHPKAALITRRSPNISQHLISRQMRFTRLALTKSPAYAARWTQLSRQRDLKVALQIFWIFCVQILSSTSRTQSNF